MHAGNTPPTWAASATTPTVHSCLLPVLAVGRTGFAPAKQDGTYINDEAVDVVAPLCFAFLKPKVLQAFSKSSLMYAE